MPYMLLVTSIPMVVAGHAAIEGKPKALHKRRGLRLQPGTSTVKLRRSPSPTRLAPGAKSLKKPYRVEAARYDFGPVTVPEGCVLVLGDNRTGADTVRQIL